jgi:hypothetical protein
MNYKVRTHKWVLSKNNINILKWNDVFYTKLEEALQVISTLTGVLIKIYDNKGHLVWTSNTGPMVQYA